MLQTLVQQAVEAQFAQFFGAAPYERSEARQGLRNGSRTRWLVTRVGKIEIRIPRERAGAFSPTLFVRYRRHEQALLSTLAECYLQACRRAKCARSANSCVARR
jgi:transposase-like protein